MKLMICNNCHDVVKLHIYERPCGCGKCRGAYITDGMSIGVNVWVSGPARVLCLDNADFAAALACDDEIRVLKAWTLPTTHEKIEGDR